VTAYFSRSAFASLGDDHGAAPRCRVDLDALGTLALSARATSRWLNLFWLRGDMRASAAIPRPIILRRQFPAFVGLGGPPPPTADVTQLAPRDHLPPMRARWFDPPLMPLEA
jgi:hypothetical protein